MSEITRSKLKEWIELEEIRSKLIQAIERKEVRLISDGVLSYVSVACNFDINDLEELSWIEVITLFSEASIANHLKIDLPFLRNSAGDEEAVWEYEGRTWYLYAHMLAKEYGWSLNEIAEMDVKDAFSLVQEIMISNQLNREWQWALSGNSIGYDSATKKSKFTPLDRPVWMRGRALKEPKKIKIPKAILPVGNVISFRDFENVIN